ncbi:MAG: hypothetical protein ACOX9R_01690 [Armatimonadota bacterium]
MILKRGVAQVMRGEVEAVEPTDRGIELERVGKAQIDPPLSVSRVRDGDARGGCVSGFEPQGEVAAHLRAIMKTHRPWALRRDGGLDGLGAAEGRCDPEDEARLAVRDRHRVIDRHPERCPVDRGAEATVVAERAVGHPLAEARLLRTRLGEDVRASGILAPGRRV